MTSQDIDIITWAGEHAEQLLAPLGNRWLHTKGVVRAAEHIGKMLNEEDRKMLVAAAYLHDIGYAPQIQKTGFHPLDGAYYLLSLKQDRLASLVAHHSEAQFEAAQRGLLPELKTIPRDHATIVDALTYCDMHTSATGQEVSFEERIDDILQRYPEGSMVNQAICQAIPSYIHASAKIQRFLKDQSML